MLTVVLSEVGLCCVGRYYHVMIVNGNARSSSHAAIDKLWLAEYQRVTFCRSWFYVEEVEREVERARRERQISGLKQPNLYLLAAQKLTLQMREKSYNRV